MGGKGGGGTEQLSFVPQTSTIDTNPPPVDLTSNQAAIDVQKAAREATAAAPNPIVPQSAPTKTLGDTAVQTLSVPDFLKTTTPLQPAPLKKSKLVTTDEGKAAKAAAEGNA